MRTDYCGIVWKLKFKLALKEVEDDKVQVAIWEKHQAGINVADLSEIISPKIKFK